MKKERKDLQQMTLLDNFLFRETMNVPELYSIVVNVCMERHFVFKGKPHVEKVFSTVPKKRGIRVDVYNETVDEMIFAVEMQGENTGNLRKRSRFYQGEIDVQLLDAGERDFNRMKDLYLIMICPFDLFGKAACRYTFYEVCEEFPDLKLADGGCRMFINTKGKNRDEFSEEFVEFLDYLNAPVEEAEKYTTTDRMKLLHKGIVRLKQNKEVNDKYMSLWEEIEDYKDEARAEGLAEGRAEGLAEGQAVAAGQIVEMGQEFGLSVNDILLRIQRKLEISQSEAEKYFAIYAK